MAELIIRDAVIVTVASTPVVRGDLAITDGRITEIGVVRSSATEEIDAQGSIVLPGLVQAHVHLCQTLFRGLSDDVDVVDWLRGCIWPLEQAHDAASMSASCRLGVTELLLSGTTTALSMETVRHTDESFAAAEALGLRGFIGKALMDREEPGTDMYGEDTEDAWTDVQRLVRRWDGTADGRLRVALSPRCPRGVTDELWNNLVLLANSAGLVMHTHVDENRLLTEYHETTPEGRDIRMLARLGALNERLVMAHCVWPNEAEIDLLTGSGATVCHCPSANLKLASGVARVPLYLDRGINVALGADGAPCNNNLDGFHEMRLAALIHKPTYGPKVLPSATVLRMATMGGAQALGIADQVGSLEVGKLADVVVLWPRRVRSAPSGGGDPTSDIVYSRGSQDVRTVLVGGRVVVRDGILQTGDEQEIMRTAEEQRSAILSRTPLQIGQAVA